jgi:hypothetical protein
VSGRCFYHLRPRAFNPLANNVQVQDRLLEACEKLSSISLPG